MHAQPEMLFLFSFLSRGSPAVFSSKRKDKAKKPAAQKR